MDRRLTKEGGGRPGFWPLAAYCLLVAAGCLLVCSKSSPLYPINDWSDANIYFSMGKGMAQLNEYVRRTLAGDPMLQGICLRGVEVVGQEERQHNAQ